MENKDLAKYENKTIKELVDEKVIQIAKRGLHPNVNNYLYLTVKFLKENETSNLFLTKASAKNFNKGEKPGLLKIMKTGDEGIYKIGMGSLEFSDELDD